LDALDHLAIVLYGRPATAREYLGGSNAKILEDAAKILERLLCELKEKDNE